MELLKNCILSLKQYHLKMKKVFIVIVSIVLSGCQSKVNSQEKGEETVSYTSVENCFECVKDFLFLFQKSEEEITKQLGLQGLKPISKKKTKEGDYDKGDYFQTKIIYSNGEVDGYGNNTKPNQKSVTLTISEYVDTNQINKSISGYNIDFLICKDYISMDQIRFSYDPSNIYPFKYKGFDSYTYLSASPNYPNKMRGKVSYSKPSSQDSDYEIREYYILPVKNYREKKYYEEIVNSEGAIIDIDGDVRQEWIEFKKYREIFKDLLDEETIELMEEYYVDTFNNKKYLLNNEMNNENCCKNLNSNKSYLKNNGDFPYAKYLIDILGEEGFNAVRGKYRDKTKFFIRRSGEENLLPYEQFIFDDEGLLQYYESTVSKFRLKSSSYNEPLILDSTNIKDGYVNGIFKYYGFRGNQVESEVEINEGFVNKYTKFLDYDNKKINEELIFKNNNEKIRLVSQKKYDESGKLTYEKTIDEKGFVSEVEY